MVKLEHLRKLKNTLNGKAKFATNILLDIALKENIPSNFSKDKKISNIFTGLRRYKFVRHVPGSNSYALTPKGEKRLWTLVIDKVKINNPSRWNGKWYLVMYDLPIRFKKARNSFRWKLKELGFFQFQKSAWIYPYPCEQEILFIADFYGVGKHVEILEVDKILDDRKLRNHFDL